MGRRAVVTEVATMLIRTKTDNYGRLYATVTEEDFDGSPVISEYRTDNRGCGLWEWDRFIKDWRQIRGTSQFSVRDRAALRRKLRRMLG